MKSSLSTGTFTIAYTVLCIFYFQNNFTFSSSFAPSYFVFSFIHPLPKHIILLQPLHWNWIFQVPNHQSIFFQSSFSWTSQFNMRPSALPFSSYFSCFVFFFSSVSQQSFVYFSYQVYNLGSSNNSITFFSTYLPSNVNNLQNSGIKFLLLLL